MSKIKCEQCDEMRVGRCYSAECPVELQIAANSHATLAAENAALKALVAEMVEAMEGADHFSDAVAYRDDTLSISLRQWLNAFPALITRAKEAVS